MLGKGEEIKINAFFHIGCLFLLISCISKTVESVFLEKTIPQKHFILYHVYSFSIFFFVFCLILKYIPYLLSLIDVIPVSNTHTYSVIYKHTH